jgi:hypothetical protein
MGRDGLLIGEVASRSGVSRKALRLYYTDVLKLVYDAGIEIQRAVAVGAR